MPFTSLMCTFSFVNLFGGRLEFALFIVHVNLVYGTSTVERYGESMSDFLGCEISY